MHHLPTHRAQKRLTTNIIIFLAIFAPAAIVTQYYDIFEIFISWVHKHHVWYLDELVSMLILCLLPYLTYLTYRFHQLNTTLSNNESIILGLSRQNELILNAVADGIFGLDNEGKVTFINPSAALMLKTARSQVMGEHYQKMVYGQTPTRSSNPEKIDAIATTLKNAKSHSDDDAIFIRNDNTNVAVEYTCTPIHQDEQFVGAVVTFRDISDHKQTEDKLTRLAAAVRQTADMTIITDNQGIIQYVNPAFERLSLYNRDDVCNQPIATLKSDQQSPIFYKNMVQVLARGDIWKDRFVTRKKNGETFHVDVIISPIRDRSDNIINYVAMARDITREVELGRQLRRSQRLEAVGTLAGGISHDFNNILTAILSYTDLAMDDLPEDSLTHSNLQEVMIAATRARDLIKQLLTFSRRGERAPIPIHLGEVVKEAINLLKAVLPSNISFKYHLSDDEIQVMADPIRIHQVVMNLCTNAAQAMWDKEGRLEIRLEKAQIDNSMDGATVTNATLQSGDYMLLTVADDGCGIPKENLDRIFEPFFSTKGTGKGSGLGLSVVHGIIQNHNCIINVKSTEGEGTTFMVYLPSLTNYETRLHQEPEV